MDNELKAAIDRLRNQEWIGLLEKATRADIFAVCAAAESAESELATVRQMRDELIRLRDVVGEVDVKIIDAVLDQVGDK